MRYYHTQFSTYEVDEERRLIRRLVGLASPTPRQGLDGEWKQYVTLYQMTVAGDDGPSLFIDWDGEGHGTLTSKLAEVPEESSTSMYQSRGRGVPR